MKQTLTSHGDVRVPGGGGGGGGWGGGDGRGLVFRFSLALVFSSPLEDARQEFKWAARGLLLLAA